MGESKADVLVFIDDAIAALSLHAERISDDGRTETVPAIASSIALDLDRVDCAIGPKGASMFATLAERIREASIAVHAARQALTGDAP